MKAAVPKAAVPKGPRMIRPAVRPSASQSMIKELVSEGAVQNDAATAYVRHIIDADTPPVGVPQMSVSSHETGLIQSTMSIDVNVTFDTTTDSGRFAVVINPTLGSASSALEFKVAVVETATGWPTDFTDSASFQRQSGGKAHTTDPNFDTMVTPNPMYYQSDSNSSGAGIGGPLGPGGTFYTVNPATSDEFNSNFPGVSPIVSNDALSTTNYVTLPVGQYTMDVRTLASAASGANYLVDVDPVTASNAEVSQQDYDHTAAAAWEGTYVITVYKAPARIRLQWTAAVGAGITWNSTMFITSSWARPDQLVVPARDYPLDGGLINTYTPVACRCLATAMLPELIAGGDICGALVPPETCEKAIFTNQADTGTGNLLWAENLRSVPNSYSGKYQDGAYGVWKPFGVEDVKLYKPSEAIARSYPCLVIAGKCNSNLTAGTMFAVRLIITSTYQFTSLRKCFPMQVRDGDMIAMEKALRLLVQFRDFSGNPEHFQRIRAFLQRLVGAGKSVVDFYGRNKSWIVPAASAIVGLI